MLWQILTKEKKDLVYLYLYAIVSGLVSLSLPLGIQAIISLLSAGIFASSLYIICAIVVGGVAFYGMLQIFQLEIVERLRQKIFVEGAFRFTHSFINTSESKTLEMNLPERANRFFDVLTMQKNLPKILIDFTSACLQIFFGIILLTIYHAIFAAVGIVLIGFLVVSVWYQFRQTLYAGIAVSKKKYAALYWLQQVSRGFLMFKHTGNNMYADENTDVLSTEYIISRNNYFKGMKRHYILLTIFKTAIAAAVLLVGSWLVFEGDMNIAQLVASEIVIVLTLAAAEKLMFTVDAAYDMLIADYKVQDVLELPQENNPQHTYIQPAENTLKLEAKILLSNQTLDLQINTGDKICVSGLDDFHISHATKMLLGFYTENYQDLLLNNISYKDLPLSYIRRYISDNVLQDAFVPATIYENIALLKKSTDAGKLSHILSITKLNDWIKSQPQGLNTPLDRNIQEIPAEIRRRIVLARILLQTPQLLIIKAFTGDAIYADIVVKVINTYPEMAILVFSEDEMIRQHCNKNLNLGAKE
ncbi:MAG: hypothetical protein ACXWW0_10240 [Bacteroidia bacterium]